MDCVCENKKERNQIRIPLFVKGSKHQGNFCQKKTADRMMKKKEIPEAKTQRK